MAEDSKSPDTTGLKILITEGSSISARQAIYDLGPYHSIDIIDPSPLCQSRFSRYVRHWHRAPSFTQSPREFLAFLGRLLREEKYDVLLPLHDEVFLLSRIRKELSKYVSVAIPDFSAVEVLQSKIRFHNLLKELDIPQPAAQILSERTELEAWRDFPRYLKADYGTAGQAVRLVENQGDLMTALDDFELRGWWSSGVPILLQQPAGGEQGFVRGVFRDGELVAHHETILEMRGVGGAAVAKVSVKHPSVEEHLRRLGRRLGWHGVLFCDYFYDEATRSPLYIEANPRIGDSANATFSGTNLMQKWVSVALGRHPPPPPDPELGVKSHSALLIMLSRALEGAGRRELWNELSKWRNHQGIYHHSRDEMTRPAVDRGSLVPFVWIVGRLLLRPSAARRVVQGTVAGYALNTVAAQRIRELPLETLVESLRGASPAR